MKKSRKSLSRSGKRRSRKSTNVTNNLLHNKMVLHLTMVLFVFNVLAFLFFKDMQSLFLLVIVLCITYLFDQNMIIVLLVPMLFVGLLIVLRKGFMGNKVMEGMKEGVGVTEEEEGNEEMKTMEVELEKSGMKKLGRDADDDKMAEVTKKENGKIIHVDDQGNEVELVEKDFKPPPPEKKDGNDEGSDSENFKSGFANINNEDTKDSLKKMVDDYDKMGKKFKSVVSESSLDPQSLETQMKVVDQMNALTPVMKNVTSLLEKIDVNNINKLVGSMGNILGGNN